MIDWWEENGVPTYIAVSAYMGLVTTKKKSSSSSSAKGGNAGNDLNELLKLAGPGGMIN